MSGQWTRVGAMDAVKPLVLNAETMMNVLPLLLMASDNLSRHTHTRTTVDSTGCQPLAMERILLLIHASATIYYCTCHFRTILFKLSSGVRGNPRPGKILPQRTVHPKFDCSQPFYSQSAARGALSVPRTRLQLDSRAFVWLVQSPGQSTTGHSFRTYISNFQKHAKNTFFLTFFLQ